MRFLVDNQLPPSLARWLRDRGHEAEHVFESGLHLLDDRALWERALADARIVVSKDEDFLYLSSQPNDAGRFLWVRLGNCRNDALIAAFSASFDTIIAAGFFGRHTVPPLRDDLRHLPVTVAALGGRFGYTSAAAQGWSICG